MTLGVTSLNLCFLACKKDDFNALKIAIRVKWHHLRLAVFSLLFGWVPWPCCGKPRKQGRQVWSQLGMRDQHTPARAALSGASELQRLCRSLPRLPLRRAERDGGPAPLAAQTMRLIFNLSICCKTSYLCVSPSNQFSCEGFSRSEDRELLDSLWSESIATEQEAASPMRYKITQNFFKNFCLLLGNKLLYLKSTQTFHISNQHKTEYLLSQNIPGVPGCQLSLIASRQISCLEPWTAKELTWVQCGQGGLFSVWMEESLGENGYMFMCGWVPLLPRCNYHSVVNRLFSNIK